MSDFKGRHFGGEIVLWAVRWYCRYGISYRDLEQMMAERGVSVDHSTLYRWVQKYAPEIEKRLHWHWRRPRSGSWRVDETYVKVRGKWAYLYRAVDKLGNTIDFYLSPTRNTAAAKRFLAKALRGLKEWEQPEVINTDKAPTYAAALVDLLHLILDRSSISERYRARIGRWHDGGGVFGGVFGVVAGRAAAARSGSAAAGRYQGS
jgi:transposase, IS6 family